MDTNTAQGSGPASSNPTPPQSATPASGTPQSAPQPAAQPGGPAPAQPQSTAQPSQPAQPSQSGQPAQPVQPVEPVKKQPAPAVASTPTQTPTPTPAASIASAPSTAELPATQVQAAPKPQASGGGTPPVTPPPSSTESAPVAAQPTEKPDEGEGRKSKMLYIVLAIVVVVVLAGVAIAVMIINGTINLGGEKESDTDDSTEETLADESDVASYPEDNEDDSDAENTEEDTVTIYFYEGPLVPNNPLDDIVGVERTVEGSDVYSFIIQELLSGPTTEEESMDYVNPIALTGVSSCAGNSFTYEIEGGTTFKLTFCKTIDPVLDSTDAYAGSTLNAQARVLKVLRQSLLINDLTKLEVYDKNENCYAPDTGLNDCTF